MTFTFTLSSPELTSAGIFHPSGKLIKTLWEAKEYLAGTHDGTWDGSLNNGQPAPTGVSYLWKVVLNRNIYENIGVIGSTGVPQDTLGHVPFFLEGVAVDDASNWYTVHDWNEPHHDVHKISNTTGKVIMNSGHPIGNASLKAIAVEPDGSIAYVTTNRETHDLTQAEFSVFRLNMAPGIGDDQRIIYFTQAGHHIGVYNRNAVIPAGVSDEDKAMMGNPLISVALLGPDIYVTDALGGRIIIYDKVTGAEKQVIGGLPLACGISVGSDGRIWVGHEHSRVSIYNRSGARLATPIADLGDVRAISVKGNLLAVVDRYTGIRKYTIAGTALSLIGQYGQPKRSGDRAPDRVWSLYGMAMNAAGEIVFTDRIGNGGRFQKLDAQMQPVWQEMALENSSVIVYHKDDPDTFVSAFRNFYHVNKADGSWQFLGAGGSEKQGERGYFNQFDVGHFGPPRLVKFGDATFFYFLGGDSIAIYRVEPSGEPDRGPTLKLASVLGGIKPNPAGKVVEPTWAMENRYLWSWNDTQGDGVVQYTSVSDSKEVTLAGSPFVPNEWWQFVCRSAGVDDQGWIWLSCASQDHVPVAQGYQGETIWVIKPSGVNSLGNPIYKWTDAVRVGTKENGRNSLDFVNEAEEFGWHMINHAGDSVYALAYARSHISPPDPRFASGNASWMAGNLLYGFDWNDSSLSDPRWAVMLPRQSIGMAVIPGGAGGVFVGANSEEGNDDRPGVISHYSRDGLRLASFKSHARFGENGDPRDRTIFPSGGLDTYLAISCNRDPRDNKVDVFAEDNYNQRVFWYRIDDSKTQTLQGSLIDGPPPLPDTMTVNLQWDAPAPAPASYNIYKQATPAVKIGSSTTTSFAATLNPGDSVFVRSVNASGESVNSNVVQVLALPAPPTNLRIVSVS